MGPDALQGPIEWVPGLSPLLAEHLHCSGDAGEDLLLDVRPCPKLGWGSRNGSWYPSCRGPGRERQPLLDHRM